MQASASQFSAYRPGSGSGALLLPGEATTESIHDWYDSRYNLPVGSVGADPEDTNDLLSRLQGPFDPEARVQALRTYAARNKGPQPQKNKFAPGSDQDAAVGIIQKVFNDGQSLQSLQKAEMETVRLLQGGMRDYIDYALDEVERYAKIGKTGAVTSFSWRSQANPGDVPSLRRSMGENGVSPQVIQALVLAKPPPKSHGRKSILRAGEKSFDALSSSVARRRAERMKRPGEEERFGVI